MIKGQTKKHSFLESCANIAIGYGIAIAGQLAIFPLFGMHPSLDQNLKIGALFTIISLVRSYLLRRLFNRIMLRPKRVVVWQEPKQNPSPDDVYECEKQKKFKAQRAAYNAIHLHRENPK